MFISIVLTQFSCIDREKCQNKQSLLLLLFFSFYFVRKKHQCITNITNIIVRLNATIP